MNLTHLQRLEAESIHIIREAIAEARLSEWKPEALEFFDFVASSKRGCATSRRINQQVDEDSEE